MMLLNTMLGAATLASSAAATDLKNATGNGHDNTLIDFENPAENLKAFVKLTASLDPSAETAGWFGGTIYSVIGDQKKVEPLSGVEG